MANIGASTSTSRPVQSNQQTSPLTSNPVRGNDRNEEIKKFLEENKFEKKIESFLKKYSYAKANPNAIQKHLKHIMDLLNSAKDIEALGLTFNSEVIPFIERHSESRGSKMDLSNKQFRALKNAFDKAILEKASPETIAPSSNPRNYNISKNISQSFQSGINFLSGVFGHMTNWVKNNFFKPETKESVVKKYERKIKNINPHLSQEQEQHIAVNEHQNKALSFTDHLKETYGLVIKKDVEDGKGWRWQPIKKFMLSKAQSEYLLDNLRNSGQVKGKAKNPAELTEINKIVTDENKEYNDYQDFVNTSENAKKLFPLTQSTFNSLKGKSINTAEEFKNIPQICMNDGDFKTLEDSFKEHGFIAENITISLDSYNQHKVSDCLSDKNQKISIIVKDIGEIESFINRDNKLDTAKISFVKPDNAEFSDDEKMSLFIVKQLNNNPVFHDFIQGDENGIKSIKDFISKAQSEKGMTKNSLKDFLTTISNKTNAENQSHISELFKTIFDGKVDLNKDAFDGLIKENINNITDKNREYKQPFFRQLYLLSEMPLSDSQRKDIPEKISHDNIFNYLNSADKGLSQQNAFFFQIYRNKLLPSFSNEEKESIQKSADTSRQDQIDLPLFKKIAKHFIDNADAVLNQENIDKINIKIQSDFQKLKKLYGDFSVHLPPEYRTVPSHEQNKINNILGALSKSKYHLEYKAVKESFTDPNYFKEEKAIPKFDGDDNERAEEIFKNFAKLKAENAPISPMNCLIIFDHITQKISPDTDDENQKKLKLKALQEIATVMGSVKPEDSKLTNRHETIYNKYSQFLSSDAKIDLSSAKSVTIEQISNRFPVITGKQSEQRFDFLAFIHQHKPSQYLEKQKESISKIFKNLEKIKSPIQELVQGFPESKSKLSLKDLGLLVLYLEFQKNEHDKKMSGKFQTAKAKVGSALHRGESQPSESFWDKVEKNKLEIKDKENSSKICDIYEVVSGELKKYFGDSFTPKNIKNKQIFALLAA